MPLEQRAGTACVFHEEIFSHSVQRDEVSDLLDRDLRRCAGIVARMPAKVETAAPAAQGRRDRAPITISERMGLP